METSKTISIQDSQDLLVKFTEATSEEQFVGFSFRLISTRKGLELRLERNGQVQTHPIRPRLHASRQWLKDFTEETTDLVLAPHVPEPLAADLRQAGINHADLNGRLFLAHGWALIDRRPAARRHRGPDASFDVFAPKTSRLVRGMLAHRDREWTQEELTIRTGLSRGLVSRALAHLIEEEFVHQEAKATRTTPARYRVHAFDRLLDAWQRADHWVQRANVHQFSVLTSEVGELAAAVRDLLRNHANGAGAGVFTQWFAARLRHAYTDSPVVSAYVRSLPETTLPFARPVANGGNLWFIVPKDEGVFQEVQEVDGFPLVCDAQIYLDLQQVGGRGPEQATALRQWEGFAR